MKKTLTSRTRLATLLAVAAVAVVAAAVAVLPGDNASARIAIGTAIEAAQPAVPAVTFEDATLVPAAAQKQLTPVAAPQPSGAATPKRTASAPTTAKPTTASARPATSSGDELAEARRILAGLIAKYPILKGTTVSFGDTKGYQAICYYKSGRIVINPNHTASLSRILNHEVWHIIDWRDNGRIDWGENVPPR
ncbi:MAG: hypothetical protein QMC94_03160 [Anaerosomatales bacterium]|nr:hypothetical protein [Anaerosomatales bacterium]